MSKKIVGAKIACLDFSLNKAKMKLGVQVLIDDPSKLEGIRQRWVLCLLSLIFLCAYHDNCVVTLLCPNFGFQSISIWFLAQNSDFDTVWFFWVGMLNSFFLEIQTSFICIEGTMLLLTGRPRNTRRHWLVHADHPLPHLLLADPHDDTSRMLTACC